MRGATPTTTKKKAKAKPRSVAKKKVAKKAVGAPRVNSNGVTIRHRDEYRVRMFIENMGLGHTPTKAAKLAGWANPGRESKELLKDVDIVAEIQRLQLENQKISKLSREDVMERLIDAFDIAKLQGDPQAMVRSMAEVNRMNGFYAPEKKVLELTDGSKTIQEQVQGMTKEALLEELQKKEEHEVLDARLLGDGTYGVDEDGLAEEAA